MARRRKSSNVRSSRGQAELIQILEGMGDITVVDVRHGKIERVTVGLEKIHEILEGLIDLRDTKPDRFEELFLSCEYRDWLKKDKTEAGFQLELRTEKALPVFTAGVSQFVRIHKEAVERGVEEAMRQAVRCLVWLLERVCSMQGVDVLVRHTLEYIQRMMRTSADRERADTGMAAYEWYLHVVSRRYGAREHSFDIEYLSILDDYLDVSLRYLVRQGHGPVFHEFIRSLYYSPLSAPMTGADIWHLRDAVTSVEPSGHENYRKLNEEQHTEATLEQLSISFDHILSREELEEWCRRLDRLVELFGPLLDTETKTGVEKRAKDLKKGARGEFLIKNLVRRVFVIAAYCLFKGRTDFIRDLWGFKDPKDRDATFVGRDFFPTRLDDLCRLFFIGLRGGDVFDHWEDNHGSTRYLSQYFLLLLMRYFIKSQSDGQDAVSLDGYDVHTLSQFPHWTERLEAIANEMCGNHLTGEVLADYKYDGDSLLKERAPTFLRTLRTEAGKCIEKYHVKGELDKKKVAEFKTEFIDEFHKKAMVRAVFDLFSSIDLELGTKRPDLVAWRVRENLTDKACFFADWHVSFHEWGRSYGAGMARSEDGMLLAQLAANCEDGSLTNLDSICGGLGEGRYFILAGFSVLRNHLRDHPGYIDSWHAKEREDMAGVAMSCFAGAVECGSLTLPVFRLRDSAWHNTVLLVNAERLGTLTQYDPRPSGAEHDALEDIFWMRVEEVAKCPDKMESILEKAPTWLQKHGDREKQEEHLRTLALIQIAEKLEWTEGKPESQEGQSDDGVEAEGEDHKEDPIGWRLAASEGIGEAETEEPEGADSNG